MTDNLPTLYKEHSQVTVVAPGSGMPEIVSRLQPVRTDADHVREQVERYEAFARLSRDDHKVLRTLKAIEEGRALISLSETLRRAGSHGTSSGFAHLPTLALARPRMRKIRCRVDKPGNVSFRQINTIALPWMPQSRTFFEFTDSKFADPHSASSAWWTADATVPPAPPEVRLHHNLKDKDTYILFEAKWTNINEHRPFTIDPALIQRVQGDVYAVLAVWELTAIEAAALA